MLNTPQDKQTIESPSEELPSCRPFLKWAGGKTKLLPEILRRVPAEYATYYEPFVGGGAVFFALAPKNAVLGDISLELTNCYECVRDDVETLIENLSHLPYSAKQYYKIRALDRRGDYWTFPKLERAARLIYLNKTCFNGLYRVNSKGFFNVPFGFYENPTIVDQVNLRACSAALKSAGLRTGHFAEILNSAKAGDFVYLDPPYVPASETANFVGYSKDGFGLETQQQLASVCAELNDRGVKFLLSNSDNAQTRELYSAFTVEEVLAPRFINSVGSKRGAVPELLVRNY